MGLLTKLNEKKKPLGNNDYISSINTKKKNQIEKFLEKADSLDHGFEYSNKLLELYSSLLDFKKAALLVPEQYNEILVPLSFSNIDVTTVRHLRIQYTIFSNEFNNYCEILKKNNKKIKFLKQYFSIREFSALNSVLLLPFYSRNSIKAVLLIIDPKDNVLKICKNISSLSEKYILNMYKSIKPFTNISKPNEQDKAANPVLLLQGIINSIKTNMSVFIITVDFESLKNAIIHYLPNIEPYEISNNIFKAISKLVNPDGKIYKTTSVKCLLFYKIKKGKSLDIMIHQLNLAISTFFNLSSSLPPIQTSIKEIDLDETTNANKILDGFI